MSQQKRKPNHPGIILEELYIKPLDLNLQELAENLDISRNYLFKIRAARACITPSIAIRLAEAFDTTPNLWLNLQQKYDLWIEENEKTHKPVTPLYTHKPVNQRSRRMKARS
ncbi:MAG TPA: HigA family addiction module antitoxin [Parachlamydiaceae bacterium]|nr:HigA family addiction module antitoxin [Parachlamydiaceae bacterium]